MATGKKYFWIKLKTDFMTSDKVDYLMSQSNGAEYVVLYQMLCMKCINTDGVLARQIGEVIIPFDAEKIARDCKYFSIDTVKQAFQLFIQLGMIYQESNGYLRIADFENMVGSETDWAERKRIQRKNKDNLLSDNTETMENVQENVHKILEIDIRDRDRDRYINSTSSEKSEENKNATKLKQNWNETYIKLYNRKPDADILDKKSLCSYWSSVVKQIQNRLKNYSFEILDNAIKYAAMDSWIIQNGFLINLVLSETNIDKSIHNISHTSQNYQQQKNDDAIKKSLANKISLGEWDG